MFFIMFEKVLPLHLFLTEKALKEFYYSYANIRMVNNSRIIISENFLL